MLCEHCGAYVPINGIDKRFCSPECRFIAYAVDVKRSVRHRKERRRRGYQGPPADEGTRIGSWGDG